MSPETLKSSKPAGATDSSTAAKGNSQDIWKGISFATVENKPLFIKATPTADQETKQNENSPVFKSFLASEPIKAKTSVFGQPEAKQDSGVKETQKEVAPALTEKASFPLQIQEFDFGETGGPVPFTSTSSSFPARVTRPVSTRTSSLSGQTLPSVKTQAKEKAAQRGAASDKAPKVNMSKIGAAKEETRRGETRKEMSEIDDGSPREKKQKQKMPEEENAPKEEEIPEDAPTPAEPSRNQRRAAKKQQKEAEKKAEKEAKTANAQASKRVQQAMMMR